MSTNYTRSDYYTVCLHALDMYLARIDRNDNVALTRDAVSSTRLVMEALRDNAIKDEFMTRQIELDNL